MIRAAAIKRITEEIVLSKLAPSLKTFGFKYVKTKSLFKKSQGNFDHIIAIKTLHSPLVFDEDADELFLKFDILINVKSPKFDKWIKKTLKTSSYFYHRVEGHRCLEAVNFEQLEEKDFYKPSESRKFKNYVTSLITGPDTEPRINLTEFKGQLPRITMLLNDLATAVDLFEHKSPLFRNYYRLLVFENEIALAKTNYLKTIEEGIKSIEEMLKKNPTEAKKRLEGFDDLIEEAQILLPIEITNPFTRSLKKVNLKDQKVRLAPQLGYEESLRFDTTMVDIKSLAIYDAGTILILTTKYKLIKIDASGAFKTIAQLAFDPCFQNDRHNSLKVRWMSTPGIFVCNNYLIDENDAVIELPLDFDTSKYKENTLDPNIKTLAFDESIAQFHILFMPYKPYSGKFNETYHFIYDSAGTLLATNTIERNCFKLNLQRKELIATCKDNSCDVLDFDGNIKTNLKFGNGNNNIAMSPDGNLLVFHFYGAKSQVYHLDTGKKSTLWAHPTYIKGYKEKFYNDINHNFGLTMCTFSPDGNYLVGCADHGKYVVWDTKKFERKELIPSEASMDIFNWFTTTVTGNTARRNYFTPYVATLENQEFFVNRRYDIKEISFLQNGSYTITQISDSLLCWDATFKNVGHVYGIGRVTFSSNNYLAFISKNELVVCKRDPNFNDTFESSVFREQKGEDSFIQNILIEKSEEKTLQAQETTANLVLEEKVKKTELMLRQLIALL
jgi:hypothetical protein